jgi:hypothetical protein
MESIVSAEQRLPATDAQAVERLTVDGTWKVSIGRNTISIVDSLELVA